MLVDLFGNIAKAHQFDQLPAIHRHFDDAPEGDVAPTHHAVAIGKIERRAEIQQLAMEDIAELFRRGLRIAYGMPVGDDRRGAI